MSDTPAIPQLPPPLADVALIDATTAAAVGGMGISWWPDQVRLGRAPAPVVRRPRCTRWRLADVSAFWASFAEQAKTDNAAAERLMEHCRRMSATAKRAARAA